MYLCDPGHVKQQGSVPEEASLQRITLTSLSPSKLRLRNTSRLFHRGLTFGKKHHERQTCRVMA
jgi:hypothetical protein